MVSDTRQTKYKSTTTTTSMQQTHSESAQPFTTQKAQSTKSGNLFKSTKTDGNGDHPTTCVVKRVVPPSPALSPESETETVTPFFSFVDALETLTPQMPEWATEDPFPQTPSDTDLRHVPRKRKFSIRECVQRLFWQEKEEVPDHDVEPTREPASTTTMAPNNLFPVPQNVELRCVRTCVHGILPNPRFTEYGCSAGWDLCVRADFKIVLRRLGQTVLVPTGLAFRIPAGYYGVVYGTESTCARKYLTMEPVMLDHTANIKEVQLWVRNAQTGLTTISGGDVLFTLVLHKYTVASLCVEKGAFD